MLLDGFLQVAERTPSALAIADGHTALTYAELLSTAKGVAFQLTKGGVRPRDRVAIQMDKSCDAVVAVLGSLLAGAAYVPIDPRAPALRSAQILEDAEPRALLVHARYHDRLRTEFPEALARVAVTCSIDEGHGIAHATRSLLGAPKSSSFTAPAVTPEDTAYILYTSGSTGKPKGVELSHRAARSFVDWACGYFALGPSDHLTSFASLSFDLSIFDLFAALSSGAKVTLIAPEQLQKPRALVDQLGQWGITTLYAVPSTVQLLVREGQATKLRLPALRRVLYAGERYPVRALRAAMTALSDTRFYNLFGPTETNVCTCHAFDALPAEDATDVPIGRACEHLTVELCDETGAPVATGQSGEICVGGPAVMAGYFRNPEANQRAFLEVDSHDEEGQPGTVRLYRTGDYARRAPDGAFWFLGRRDRMVKRRGYRIELGEIEAALLRHPEIREAAATLERGDEHSALVAYVVLEAASRLSPLLVRAHCGRVLLPYQVPDSVKILTTMPRTLTGKLDFSAIAT